MDRDFAFGGSTRSPKRGRSLKACGYTDGSGFRLTHALASEGGAGSWISPGSGRRAANPPLPSLSSSRKRGFYFGSAQLQLCRPSGAEGHAQISRIFVDRRRTPGGGTPDTSGFRLRLNPRGIQKRSLKACGYILGARPVRDRACSRRVGISPSAQHRFVSLVTSSATLVLRGRLRRVRRATGCSVVMFGIG